MSLTLNLQSILTIFVAYVMLFRISFNCIFYCTYVHYLYKRSKGILHQVIYHTSNQRKSNLWDITYTILWTCNSSLSFDFRWEKLSVYMQGVPRNMTDGEKFWMSSSIYCIRNWRLFVVYFVLKIFYTNIFYFEINFTIIWLPLKIIKFLFGINK